MVNGEAAGGDVEEGFGFFGGLVLDGRIDAEVGVVGDVLGLGGGAEEAGEVATQRGEGGAVERSEVAGWRVGGRGRRWTAGGGLGMGRGLTHRGRWERDAGVAGD